MAFSLTPRNKLELAFVSLLKEFGLSDRLAKALSAELMKIVDSYYGV